MSVKVYPNIDNVEFTENVKQGDPSVKAFRLNTITHMQQSLEHELSSYSRTKGRYSFTCKALHYFSTGTAVVSGGLSGCSAGLLASGIGAPAAVATGGVSAFLGVCTLASGAINKKTQKKLQKHTAIVQLIMAKLSSFRLIISKALQDSNITDEEFMRLQADYDDYKRQKFDLQKKLRSIPPTDTETLRKQCLEEVSKTLDSVLKK